MMYLDKNKISEKCDALIEFLIYGIAFFLPISKGIIETLSIIAIFCFLFKKIIRREGLPKTHLNWAIFAYLFICFISIFISSNPKISLRTFSCKTLQDILFLFVVADTLNKEKVLRNMLSVLFVSAAILGIDGVYQNFTHKDFLRHRRDLGIPRIYASFETPNDFGCYLVTVMPFVIAGIFSKTNFRKFRPALIALFTLLIICLLLVSSRGAWFAFIGSILFMSFWIPKLLIFFIVFIFILFVLSQIPFYLRERVKFMFVIDATAIQRRILWDAALKMAYASPLFGLGLGTFMFNFNNFIAASYNQGIFYAHNCYLQTAAEIGIIGLGLFLLILSLFFIHGIRTLIISKKTFSWYILLATLTGLLGYSIQMGVDTSFYSLDLRMLFWLVLGMGSALTK